MKRILLLIALSCMVTGCITTQPTQRTRYIFIPATTESASWDWNSEPELRYNAYENKYEWARPDVQIRYNAYENKYEYE